MALPPPQPRGRLARNVAPGGETQALLEPSEVDRVRAVVAGPGETAAPSWSGLLERARVLQWLSGVPALFFLVMVLLPPLNHDAAAVLDFAERWLAGGRLYVDLVDVNPPLIFILSLVPAAIARWTPLSGPQALLLCLLGHALLLWRLCLALRRERAEGPVEAAVLAAVLPLLLVVAGSDFGQRETLMAASALPYALLAARRMEGPPVAPRLALGVATLAALAFALKPHFLAVPLLVEGLVLRRVGLARARRDPVPWLMAAIWLAYLFSIPLFFPAYLKEIVPLAWEVYADIHGAGPFSVLVTELMGAATLLLLLTLPVALRRRAGSLAQALGMAAAGAFLAAWVQHKGWTYHVMPVTILCAAALAAAAAHTADHALPPERARAAAPVLAVIAAFGIGAYAIRGGETPWRQFWFHSEQTGRLTEWLRREVGGGSILVLSPEILPVYPSVNYARLRPTLRTMSTWLLQGAYRTCPAGPAPYRDPAAMGRGEAFVFRSTAEDFARDPPRAVLVSRFARMRGCPESFDLLDYFNGHPLFARTWQLYRPRGEMDGYRLFVRGG
jgi:hypothetical protein